jgi:DNA polymerase III delta subunit
MITLLTGENSFEIERELDRLETAFEGTTERIDGSSLELKQIPDLFMGISLFATKRLVVIKNLSENKSVWTELPVWLGRISDDIDLVLIDQTPDKRTKTFKELQRVATVKEFKQWEERDSQTAQKWMIKEAKDLGFELDGELARLILDRTGLDQWQVFHALEKLSVLDIITREVIDDVVAAHPTESIFQLFETALKSEPTKLQQMLQTLELNEDPYQVFGLLSAQAFQLAVLAVAEKPNAEIAKDIGAHPFVLSKLSPYAKKLGRTKAKKIIDIFAEADGRLKTSAQDPWVILEKSLVEVSTIS